MSPGTPGTHSSPESRDRFRDLKGLEDIYRTGGERTAVVAVVEASDDATMMKISALLASTGVVSAETMTAIPMEDFTKAIG